MMRARYRGGGVLSPLTSSRVAPHSWSSGMPSLLQNRSCASLGGSCRRSSFGGGKEGLEVREVRVERRGVQRRLRRSLLPAAAGWETSKQLRAQNRRLTPLSKTEPGFAARSTKKMAVKIRGPFTLVPAACLAAERGELATGVRLKMVYVSDMFMFKCV